MLTDCYRKTLKLEYSNSDTSPGFDDRTRQKLVTLLGQAVEEICACAIVGESKRNLLLLSKLWLLNIHTQSPRMVKSKRLRPTIAPDV